jgi:hypothetical protein
MWCSGGPVAEHAPSRFQERARLRALAGCGLSHSYSRPIRNLYPRCDAAGRIQSGRCVRLQRSAGEGELHCDTRVGDARRVERGISHSQRYHDGTHACRARHARAVRGAAAARRVARAAGRARNIALGRSSCDSPVDLSHWVVADAGYFANRDQALQELGSLEFSLRGRMFELAFAHCPAIQPKLVRAQK